MFTPAFVVSLFMLMPISGLAPQKDGSAMQKKAVNSSFAERGASNGKKTRVTRKDVYAAWLEQDVRWIITPEESSAFKQLKTDEEREIFIDQFWLPRDPTPRTIVNELKQEHYRRIAFANQHFATGVLGCLADRGRIYIAYVPPDRIVVHTKKVGDSAYPAESWIFRYLEAVGNDVELEFVDFCRCNEFKLQSFPPKGPEQGRAFNSPRVKFKELEEVASVAIKFHQLPFDIRIDSTRATDATTLVALTIEVKNKDITLSEETGIPPTKTGRVEIFGRFTTLTGRFADILEDIINVKEVSRERKLTPESTSISRNTFALRPGRYRLDIVVRDVNGDRMGTLRRAVVVPAE
jgi:GWxTD domain-containing protein